MGCVFSCAIMTRRQSQCPHKPAFVHSSHKKMQQQKKTTFLQISNQNRSMDFVLSNQNNTHKKATTKFKISNRFDIYFVTIKKKLIFFSTMRYESYNHKPFTAHTCMALFGKYSYYIRLNKRRGCGENSPWLLVEIDDIRGLGRVVFLPFFVPNSSYF